MTLTKRPMLSLSRRSTMNRWRIWNKETDEIVELSCQTFGGGCHFLGWRKDRCHGAMLGKLSILTEPKRYVMPTLGLIKG